MKYLTTIILAFCATMAFAQTAGISGTVTCAGGDALGGVIVNIVGNDGTNVDVAVLDDGTFSVLDLPMGVDYSLSVTGPILTSSLNGVSTFDMVLIMRHLLGVEPFTDAADYIAADLNGSGTITTMDLVLMRMQILSITTSFPSGAWTFVNAPCLANIPPVNCELTINDLQSGGASIDIVGIKMGDVNGTVICN